MISLFSNTGDGEKKTKIWIILAVVVGLICLGIHIFLVWRFKRKPKGNIFIFLSIFSYPFDEWMTRCYTLFFNIDFYILSLPFYLPAISLASSYNNNSEIPVFNLMKSTDLSEISGELGLEGNQLSGAELPLFNFSYILAYY